MKSHFRRETRDADQTRFRTPTEVRELLLIASVVLMLFRGRASPHKEPLSHFPRTKKGRSKEKRSAGEQVAGDLMNSFHRRLDTIGPSSSVCGPRSGVFR